MRYIFWLAATIIFVIIELAVPALVTIWFAMAAGVVTIMAIFIDNLYLELSVFLILSVIFLIFTRQFAKRYLQPKDTYSSDMIGARIIVIKKENKNEYAVKFKGAVWTACSEENFYEGEEAKIKSFNGNKIILEKVIK